MEFKSKDTTVPQEVDKGLKFNRMIEKLYGPLVGTYEGEMLVPVSGSNELQKQPVDLVIYISSQSYSNPDGTPGVRKIPLAFFRVLGNWIEYTNMKAEGLSSERNTFSLLSLASAGADSVSALNLAFSKGTDGNISGISLEGDVRSVSGVIGTTKLSFKNKSTVVPRDTEREQKENRRLFLQQMVGLYTGVMRSQEGNIPLSIELSLVDQGGNTNTNYYLTGFYRRLDVPSGVIDLALEVTVYRKENPTRIVMTGKGKGNYFISIESRWAQGKISGALSTLIGPRGPLELSRP